MRFRGKIAVAFAVVMVIPMLLITFAFLMILRSQFLFVDSSLKMSKNVFASVANPIRFINRITKEDYEELKLCAENTPDKFWDEEYRGQISARLKSKYTYFFIIASGKPVYIGNESLYSDIKDVLPVYMVKKVNNGEYIENGNTQLFIRQVSFEKKSTGRMSVYMVTDISELEEDSKIALTWLFISMIVSMFLTAVVLALWIYGSFIKPINDLRRTANRIIRGDLETPIEKNNTYELGELCKDFDNMREHIKDLLDERKKNERKIRELVVNISHDLKTPLTAIQGYACGLIEGVASTPEKQSRYLDTINTKAKEMNVLIEELSTYAKIDMNVVPYEFRNININDYFEDKIKELKTDVELQNMEIYYIRKADKLIETAVDTERFDRVINNIISNSKKYRRKDVKGIIKITTEESDGQLKISISDNGKGIKETNLERVFDRLYREDESRNSKIGGSGLGLAIVKKIIESHGGKVWAESKQGEGTTIVILLKIMCAVRF